MNILGALFGRVTQRRRRRYARDPQRQRRLDAPVISVGNLSVGGTGKTPIVEALARMLQEAGERPAILSRGYGRRPNDGALVVSDPGGVRVTDAGLSGDEPQLLARRLPGIPVVVSNERYVAGRLAEAQFGTSVHILDDGFQHLELARDIDVLVVPPADLNDRLLPAGRLREPIAAAAAADVILVPGSDDTVTRVAQALEHPRVFGVTFALGDATGFGPAKAEAPAEGAPVVAVAGIARPHRFFAAARVAGWQVLSEKRFPDHHRYSARDVAAVEALAQSAGAEWILTTEKDAVRLEPLIASKWWAYLPLTAILPDTLSTWLLDRLRARP